MPAVDQQLVECVRHIIKGSEPLKVGVVAQKPSSLSDGFGSSASITFVSSVEWLEEFKELDVLIVNEALEKEMHDSRALDKFVASALHTLRMGGVLIVRQDLSKLNDPKKVAMMTDYLDVFRVEENGENVGFSFYAVNEVEDSVYAHQNWQDFIWTLSKKSFPGQHGENVTFRSPCFRDFLDRTQYTDTGIFAYEWIFGDNFISPGGWDQNLAILKRFGPMKTGQRMLDIGVGIGGGARQAASEFGLHVHGVDLSANMLAVALDRVHKDKDARVTYAICDATEYDFQPASFDFVFSRDCIHHIEGTEKLFSRIHNSEFSKLSRIRYKKSCELQRALKPGGKVLITMYGVGYGAHSESFKQYYIADDNHNWNFFLAVKPL
ncbi:unnamed protein product [Nippostrongylus brasiliensis]|uniref:phosphoethanolamine N-methyltransferase n=1 Tax=Nippostrongylus brasiliensis TaxID=27835 RepID=A0A0N4Y1K7_NIPBR|nr:unnamed protein product [Nippostrongylus brasiliensis]